MASRHRRGAGASANRPGPCARTSSICKPFTAPARASWCAAWSAGRSAPVAGAARRARPRAGLCGAVPGPARRGVGAGLRDHAAGQGAAAWPPKQPNQVALAMEGELPLPDRSIDRVLMVHALELAEQVAALLREVWRVLVDGGQAMIVVPNRRGLWCLSEIDALRPRPAVQRRRSSRRRCAACCSRPRRHRAGALRAAVALAPAAAHRGRLGAGRAALGEAVLRRAADGGREADLRRCPPSPPGSAGASPPMHRCRRRSRRPSGSRRGPSGRQSGGTPSIALSTNSACSLNRLLSQPLPR